MNKGVIAASAFLVIFAGVQVGSLLLGDEEKEPAAATPTSTPSVVVVPQTPKAPKPSTGTSGMPEPSPASEDAQDPAETAEVTAPPSGLVEELVSAYYTRSWRDESSRAWHEAVLALGDEELGHGLVHDYGDKPTKAETDEWRTVIVEPKGTTRVADVEVLPRSSTEDGHAVFDVEFTVEKMTERPESGWSYVFEDTWRVEYAWDGEQWLAHTIEVID